MDHKNMFMFRVFFPLFIKIQTLITFFLVVETAPSADPQFEACKVQKCEKGPYINYPFWIRGEQESFCGYPGFELSCKNSQPVLNLSNTDYIIREIAYENQSILVSNSGGWDGNCPRPIHNLSIDHNRFNFGPAHVDLFLFFNCTSPLPNEYYLRYTIDGCASLAVFGHDPMLNHLNLSRICETSVVVPVDEDENGSAETINPGDVAKFLNKEFLLKWNASMCGECKGSGGRCGFNYDSYNFRCFCPDRPYPELCRGRNRDNLGKAIGIALSLLGFGILLAMLFLCSRNKFSSKHAMLFWMKKTKTNLNVEAFLRNHEYFSPKRYSYSDVKVMTNYFKDKLGQGGYGGVFKGKLLDGCLVAVKLLGESKGNGEEFINEVASISRTSHVNIVSLLGYCSEGPHRALIYEFMPNGSLEKFIYNEKSPKMHVLLGWENLYQITIGIARGLEYLHRGCNTRILHLDIKPHNILLDQDFCPKIADFGLAKLCPKRDSIVSMSGARGTIGYIAPEVIFRNFGRVSHKSDVYSYGMMVLEMVGGRKNIDMEVDHASEIYFPHWIYERLELDEDLGLHGITVQEEEVITRKMILVGLWCIQTNPSDRPSMSRVVEMLEGSLESLQIPPRPFIYSPSRSQTTGPSRDGQTSILSASSNSVPRG